MKTEIKMNDGWHYGTGGGAWSADAYPTRDAARAAKKSSRGTQKSLDSVDDPVVALDQQSTNNQPTSEPATKGQIMTLTLKGLSKNGKRAIYVGAAQGFHVPVGAFVDKTPPQTIDIADGIFAPPVVREPKRKLTKEERAALPKPTLAEKIEKRRKALAALEAKLAEGKTEL